MGRNIKVLYWMITVVFSLLMLMSASTYLMQIPPVIEGFTHLGYPLYILKILAVAKILGVLALFGPSRWLKEWAYAGFTFNLMGASASHAFSGDGLFESLMPLVILSVLLCSYTLWKKNLNHASMQFKPRHSAQL